MASPITRRPPSPSHPLTPPADPSPTQAPTVSQPSTSQQTAGTAGATAATASNPSPRDALLSQPLTSATDNGRERRPRDHRLIHLLLASHGIGAYQERVPLQLMDFAYRYVSSVLSDAVHVQAEGYDAPSAIAGGGEMHGRRGVGRGAGAAASTTATAAATTSARAAAAAAAVEEGDISLGALRMAIAGRMSYQFQSSLPKEFLKGLAEERNRVGLGVGLREQGAVIGGVRLPPEKYCLTGVGWGVKQTWDSEGEEDEDDVEGGGDVDMAQLDAREDEGDEDMGTMEDVFGEVEGDADGEEDQEMGDS